jgi:hypothetical protein
VALDLAADGGHGEGGERAAAGIVPVHGVDQPEPRDLFQVLDRFRATPVASCHPVRERHAVTDQVVAQAVALVVAGSISTGARR